MIVLDASTTIPWAFMNQKNPYSDAALNYIHEHEAIVPPLWHLEIANVLLGAERNKRLTHSECMAFIELLVNMKISTYDQIITKQNFFTFALHHRLSAYDATYLELAIKLDLPLASLDKKIRNAAEQSGVKLFEI